MAFHKRPTLAKLFAQKQQLFDFVRHMLTFTFEKSVLKQSKLLDIPIFVWTFGVH